jgi:type I restriction enzyme S subunit
MDRLGDKVCCNPTVKLKKGEYYPLIDIEKIAPRYKTVRNQEEIVFNGQSCTKFEDRDVLFARITPCLENGKIAMADTNGKCGIGSTELFVFRGIEGISNTDYVYYLLRMNYIRQLAANSMTGASGRQRADLNFIKKIKWQFPVIEQQQKIASILSAYDDLIEKNNKRIKILEQMAENLYKEWFARFRFPNYQNAEFENGIPKGWKVVRLGEYANISTGKCNREDAEEAGIYPLFDRSQEIKKSNSWIKNCEAIIIPGEGTSFMPRYYVGKFNLHQRCYCIEPKNKSTGKYIFYSLMLNRIYFLYVATGATVPSLRQNNFTSMKIIMPKMSLVKRFDEIISLLFEQINFLEKANEKLSKQRDMLLPRLMSGKLEVK